MPRYFFDIHDGLFNQDDEGVYCLDLEAARFQAMASLSAIASQAIPDNGDRQAFMMLVRDAAGHIVYTATLTYEGLRLNRELSFSLE